VPNRRTVSDASMAAQRLHAQLHTQYDKPVDVFRIVQEQGIWLASKPLGASLFGFYLREGDAAGIVLNASHPETLQRYTCAHELGHHVLGHKSHLDEEDDVVGPTSGRRLDELAAQVFAGNLLMPLQAVNRVQRRLGIAKNQPLRAADVYSISRELDVSYSAAAWQLVTLKRLSAEEAQRFVRSGAAAAKRSMRPGSHPDEDNRAGLFIFDQPIQGLPILCRPGDELRVRLKENASTGHIWKVMSPPPPTAQQVSLDWDGDQELTVVDTSAPNADSLMRLTQDNYHSDTPASHGDAPRQAGIPLLGQRGTREFVFVAARPGRAELKLTLSRPWEDQQVNAFSASVRIGPTHILDGFAEPQAIAHAARVAER
jgi:Zn-dependent peptidase ImmA (M78 family)/predicted secreted protein